MRSLMEGSRELSHAAKPPGGILRQRDEHHAFHGWRDPCIPLPQPRWWGQQMLAGQFHERPDKRTLTNQPLVDDHGQCVLIASETGFSPKLLRGHIGCRPDNCLGADAARALGEHRDAKVTEQHLLARSHQQVLRFDVAMDDAPGVGVLECLGHLRHVVHHRGQRKCRASGMHAA